MSGPSATAYPIDPKIFITSSNVFEIGWTFDSKFVGGGKVISIDSLSSLELISLFLISNNFSLIRESTLSLNEFIWDDWKGITRRETIEGAEKAIDASIEHYAKKLKLAEGPIVVKTFK